MSKKQKKMLARILAGGALFLAAELAPVEGVARLLVFLVPYFVVGWDVLWRAVRNIAHGQVFDENFLMALATVGALALGQYDEASGVMLFYQVGELFQSYAVGRSRQSIAALMDIRPDSANLERDGEIEEVDPDEVAIGDVIVIRPGEKIPLDGQVLEGSSSIDTAALTGESMPRMVEPGDEVISGCVNLTGLLRVRVSREFGDSTVSRILDLVENSSEKKARTEAFITRFARWYTPTVVIAAAALAFIPPLFVGDFRGWITSALTFLVISCPCALVISIPLSFFGGIGGASRCGILVKGGNYLEALAKLDTVVFDKTGTLTRGTFEVVQVAPQPGVSQEDLLLTAALAEQYSNHPISQSLRRACGGELAAERARDVEEIAGRGVRAMVDGQEVLVGNARLLEDHGLRVPGCSEAGTLVYVARSGACLGYIRIADQLKPTAAEAIGRLKQLGVRRTVMLTGDSETAAKAAAAPLALDEIHAGLLPADKVQHVEDLLETKAPGGQLAFVGDGVNHAPVLTSADVDVAMGALGSDAAIEAADVVLMDDDPAKIALAVEIARRTLRVARQNIVFALGVKGIFLLLGVLRMATMWGAVFADVGVAIIAILNAMRALKVPRKDT